MSAPLHSTMTPRTSAPALVNGVALEPISAADLVARVREFAHSPSSRVVRFCAAHPILLARKDGRYRALLNRGDLNVPDGAGLSLALRVLRYPSARVAGSDAMVLLFDEGRKDGIRHYLFGGSPEVVRRLSQTLETRFPGAQIVGAEAPPFRDLRDDEWRDAAARMRLAEADLVWVGLGVPKQDYASERLRHEAAAPVIVCVGAAFDFVSGAKRRAPLWMQRAGFEWLHRLGSEPRRLWRRYIFGNPQFFAGVLRDSLARYFTLRRL